jgi:choline dehydrogenase-like flavoprotein
VKLENATPSSVYGEAGSNLTPTPDVSGPHPASDTDPEGAWNQCGTVSVAPPGRIKLSYTPNNVESFNRLKDRWVDTLKKAGHADTQMPLHAYFKKRIPLEGVGHQNGTVRMGADPANSVLDPTCKAHQLDNLYVVDASCFVSASAVNPSLTVIANSLRVARHVLETRLT